MCVCASVVVLSISIEKYLQTFNEYFCKNKNFFFSNRKRNFFTPIPMTKNKLRREGGGKRNFPFQ